MSFPHAKLIMTIAGALLALATAYLLWFGYSIASWPQVRGTVTISKARREADEYGNPVIFRELEYTYEVGHQRYVGSRVSFGLDSFRWFPTFQEHAASLVEGQRVTVWHHPRWPRLCTLQPRGTPGATVLVLGGVIYGVVTLALNM
jgi:hypothetical protein